MAMGDSSQIFENKIFPEIGSGIEIYVHRGMEIFNNEIHAVAAPPTCEYGHEDYSTTAIRIADYGARPGSLGGCFGNDIYNNKFFITGMDYPEYADYPGFGGKLYRQGLIKMNEFVTLCGRDRVPIIWFQDTSGIDVGDIAEKAELLGLGQSRFGCCCSRFGLAYLRLKTALVEQDQFVGALMQVLEDKGLLGNTLVIFHSDNGMHWPFAKSNVYVASVKTPFVLFWVINKFVPSLERGEEAKY